MIVRPSNPAVPAPPSSRVRVIAAPGDVQQRSRLADALRADGYRVAEVPTLRGLERSLASDARWDSFDIVLTAGDDDGAAAPSRRGDDWWFEGYAA